MADQYLRIVLTIIAVELAWISLKDLAPALSAQASPPAPVVIREIDLRDGGSLPVSIVGPVPLRVEAVSPLRIDSTEPLRVVNVEYTPSKRPGE